MRSVAVRAWAEALRRKPALDLWTDDGQHPGRKGSYLAACVFYAALTGRDPARSQFTAGIEGGQARLLQRPKRFRVRLQKRLGLDAKRPC